MHSAQERAWCGVISGCVVPIISSQLQSQPTELGWGARGQRGVKALVKVSLHDKRKDEVESA